MNKSEKIRKALKRSYDLSDYDSLSSLDGSIVEAIEGLSFLVESLKKEVVTLRSELDHVRENWRADWSKAPEWAVTHHVAGNGCSYWGNGSRQELDREDVKLGLTNRRETYEVRP